MSHSLSIDLHGRVGALAVEMRLDTPLDGLTLVTGPSGAGKTTLLRCLSGLTRLAGRIAVDGEPWQDRERFIPPHQRPVAHVFQDSRLFAHLSVAENLRFATRRAPAASPGERRLAWDEVVALLDLDALLKRSTTGLSGGEQQRVAIGRALLAQPRLLLLDEPTASLDTDARREVSGLVARLVNSLATPVVLVSHDPGGLAHLAQRHVRISAGRIVDVQSLMPAPDDPLAGLDAETRDALARAALQAGLGPR
jgi:molybdate transport system ATP-binding protein